MKFRTKALITFFVIIAVIFTVVTYVSFLTSSSNVQQLEKDYIISQMERGFVLIEAIKNQYTATVRDWGCWDATYTYMTSHDPTYREQYNDQNVNTAAFDIIGVDQFIMLDTDKNPVNIYTSEAAKPLTGHIPSIIELSRFFSAEQATRDLLYARSWISILNNTPVLFAETNIIRSDQTGPAAGTLIISHIINEGDLQYLTDILDAEVIFSDVHPDIPQSTPGSYSLERESTQQIITVIPLSNEKIHADTRLSSETPEDSVILSLILNRDILATGSRIWLQNLSSLLFSGFFIILLSVIAFDKFFLSRMALLYNRVLELQQNPDMDPDSLLIHGDDEITQLSAALSSLVFRLTEKTRQVSVSEKRFSEMTNLLPIPVFETDEKRILTFANSAFREFFERDEIPPLSLNLTEILSDSEDDDHVQNSFCTCLDACVGWSGELHAQKRSGTVVPVIVTCSPIYNDASECTGNRGAIIDISSLKEKEEEIRVSEQKYRNLAELLPVAVFETDADGTITFVNTATLELSGYRVFEITGRMTLDALLETKHLKGNKTGLEYLLYPGIYEKECLFRTRENILIPVILHSDDQIPGDPASGKRGVIVDISAIKQAQKAVLESEKRFREMAELLPVVVFETDSNAMLTFVNPAAIHTFQYTRDEFNRGINVFDLFSPDYIPNALEYFSQTPSLTNDRHKEYMMARKDGSTFPAIIISTPLSGENDEAGKRGVIVDISDLKEAESALAESEERLNLAVTAANMGIWDYDVLTEQTTVNEQFADLIGYDLADFYAKHQTLLSIIHPEDRALTLSLISRCITGDSEKFTQECRMMKSDGTIIWTFNIGKITKWEDGIIPMNMSGITMDITGNHHVRAALIETNRKLNLLSSMTRHDITNNLAGIFLTLELFSRRVSHDPDASELVRLLIEEVEKVNSQIAFTKDYEDLGTKEPVWVPVSDLIQGAVANLPEKPVKYINRTGSLEIFADPLIGRVFYNLLENALRHGGEGLSTICVDYLSMGDDLVLCFKNDGEPVPEHERDIIFQRGIGKNTGLGLFLVREILTITGMTISVSQKASWNVIFEIRIPHGKYRIPGDE
ncbi:MAG: PAS domain S-box protein [Methanospirillaceae archaeon]|nr:PAS domain S-box protein [Methanospirillaceae archaeon]